MQKNILPSNDYIMNVEREGYLSCTEKFTLLGGEAKVLPTLTLVPISEERKRLESHPRKIGDDMGNGNRSEEE